MKKITGLLFFLIMVFGCNKNVEVKEYNKGINIVPYPALLTKQDGVFSLDKKTTILSNSESAEKVSVYFQDKISSSTGINLKQTNSASENYISFNVDNTSELAEEAYTLTVTTGSIEVNAATEQGLYYGMQTLLQLLPAEIESTVKVAGISLNIPCVTIKDEPRFPWRAMHLDVCRHYFPVDFIKKQLDVMAMYKMNTFHWHLTEDQGWRIEIKKYPKLTELGSKRLDEGKEYGGYYTQEQVKEVVEYAAERHITIVPEIELPGHSLAALTAYPEYSCTGGPFKVRNIWGVEPDIYCAGKEETFEFIEDVIDEVCQLFPGEYFHVGGDEAPKDRWEECDDCQRRMKEEGLKNEHELQSYFIKRVEKMLLARDKKMIGWDEILEGGLAESAAVMSWRGEEGGIAASSMGHDVVMTPSNWLYLDNYQGSSKVEPVAIGGYTVLEETYSYDPVPTKISDDKKHHILGLQGNVWSEYMYTPEIAEYRIYPRIIAVAEIGWTPLENKDFQNFLERMDNQFVRLDMHNINYHIPLPEGPIDNIAIIDSKELEFTTTRPLKMYYTLDGTEPDANSTEYTGPIKVDGDATIKIRTALATGKLSNVRTINVVKQVPTEAVDVAPQNSGLKVKIGLGEYFSVKNISEIEDWEKKAVKDFETANSLFDVKVPSVGIFEGYLEIPEDGVYQFSSDMDEFYIADTLLISNDGEVKRFSRNDASIALKKGYHPVKIVFLNNVYGGWPQTYNGVHLKYKKDGEKEFTELKPEAFVY